MKNDVILNKEQEKAMLAIDGAVLVTAGAGSGKTRLLTQRIYHLISEHGVFQENILAITFTNKASREMKERIEAMLDGKCSMWISTIHSMCAVILRSHIEKMGLPLDSHYTIYSADDSQKVLKTVLKQDENEREEGILKQVGYHLSNMKNKDMSLEEYKKEIMHLQNVDTIIQAIDAYQTTLLSNNAVDFDDLLVLTRKLLSENDEVREHYQKRFKYILVDEFQDTNVVQYNIIKLLAGYHKNIFVVGDEDQCIYGWRGANVENIKNFINDYENCQVFKLEQNYRSTKAILKLANTLIEKNVERIPKTLYTENEEGKPVIFRSFSTDKEEAEFVARTIYALVQNGKDYGDIAVLMRLNALSRNFEDKFMTYRIPYKVFGGFKFYDRAEIKGMIAYLRFAVNPYDTISFEKIINYPKRGIGETSVAKLYARLEEFNGNMLKVLENVQSFDEFNAPAKLKIQSFYELITTIIEKSSELLPSELLDYIFRNAGIKSLYSDKTEDSVNREMNIQNLIASAQEFECSGAENIGLDEFLQSVALISDLDEGQNSSSAVTIATVHSVKGLEFDTVFIVGLEQKVFPIVREDTVDEEERRLMYVALTRAEQTLYLSNASERFMYGKYENMVPSKFLQELGFVSQSTFDAVSNKINIKNYGIRNYTDEYEDQIEDRTLDFKNLKNKKPLSQLNSSKFGGIRNNKNQGGKVGFDVGKRVNHAHYGEGVIKAVSGKGTSITVDVLFSVGMKSLLLEFAPLTLLD